MASDAERAANFARNVARNPGGEEYINLSREMCWDSVKYCAQVAGIINQAQYNRINGRTDLVNSLDQRVRGQNSMQGLKPGYVLGFFHNNNPIHVMIGTGHGWAAGNKNSCIGVGKAVGWELLNLANDLNWQANGSVNVPGWDLHDPYRSVDVHCRLINNLKFK